MSLIDRLGLPVPIIQAPMAGVSTPRMAAAVSEAGALGSIAVGNADADRAAFHRRAALEIMLARLADESLPPATRMEYAFVSANYVREFGDGARADRLLAQLEALIADSAGSRGESYARYLGSLIASARTIAPGGRLAPEEAGSPAD